MSDILKDLNPKQREAVTTTKGPLLIIAGAGTGKTTVIARRIAYIIEKKLAKPSEILALTFTDKAAQEMEERVDVLVPYGYIDTQISTFHAFGDGLIRDHALEIGLSPDFRVLTRPEQILFVKQNLFSFNLVYYRPLSSPYKFIDAMLSLISRAKDEDVTPQKYLKFAKNIKDRQEHSRQLELAAFYAKYEELKTEAGLVDFSDQINMPLDLFRKRLKILQSYQNRFKYILIDEYQDTNFTQNELVKMLAQKHKNICVVGDDDQSIYKFRGAAIANILEFKENYPKAKQVVLTQNYRSTQAILDSAYRLIRHNDPDRLEVRNKIDKKLKSARSQKGFLPKPIYGATLSEETDLVAKEIENLHEKEKLKYLDIAILVRANASADPFIQALNMRGIPHQFVGSFGLYDREEVKSLIAFLRFLTTFEDDLNLYYLATSELYNVLPQDIIKLTDTGRKKSKSLYQIIKSPTQEEAEISEKGKIALERLIRDQEKYLKVSRRENIGKVLYQYLQDSGYLKRLVREKSAASSEKVANIAKFFERISDFGKIAKEESTQNFSNFLEVMRTSGENPATAQIDPDLDAVNIMTIHSAKGLEFRAVFLANLVADRFPVRDRSEPIPLPDKLIKETLPVGDFHLQEERRLFYVGLTRAKDYLYLTYAKDYGGKRTRKISPFVLETLDIAQIEGMPQKSSDLEKIERFKPSGQLTLDLEAKKITTDDRILDISRIDIESYLSCALQYWYGRVAKLQVPRNYNLVYGTALHKAVEEFYRYKLRGKLLPLEALINILEEAWVAEGFLTTQHEKTSLIKAKKVITDFYHREQRSSMSGVEIEKPFKFTHQNIIVRGRIDFMKTQNKTQLLDFKSTEDIDEKKGQDRVKQSIQLKIYTLAYHKIFGKLPDEIGIYFLESGLISTVKPVQETLNEAVHAIEASAAGIRNVNFTANPKEGAFTCRYCSYSRICPSSLV